MSVREVCRIAHSRGSWSCGLFVALMVMAAPAPAQLVADGATCVLDNVATNLTGDMIIIGTNGSFTLLMLTNSATVTNAGLTIIGSASTATSNSVVVTDQGSVWDGPSGLWVGDQGASNTLAILNGGLVDNHNQSAVIGKGSSANGNTVIVSGTNSCWNLQYVRIGDNGSFNQLVISNGGTVAHEFASLGENVFSTNNAVIVTGPGSLWSNRNSMEIGHRGSGNELLITNGGSVVSGLDTVGYAGGNNCATVTGRGSLWVNAEIRLGAGRGTNRLIVADGGALLSSGGCTIGRFNSGLHTALITDPDSLWTNEWLTVGYASTANQLTISNAATVVSGTTKIGENLGAGSQSNALAIIGAGSLLTNSSDFYVGFGGSSNELTVLEGGKLADANGHLGYDAVSTGNRAWLSGNGSVWTNLSDLYAGFGGSRGQLVVSNAAKVFDQNGYIGYDSDSRSNVVLVTEADSLWSNRFNLYVGFSGGVSQLVVSNAGVVTARNLYLGYNATSTNNRVTLAGGTLGVTYYNHGTIEVRRGTLALNSGLVVTDQLRADTGPSGKFALNGGTLRVFMATVNNGLPFVIGDGTNAARYEMSPPCSGHYFADGLTVSSNGWLTGCGGVVANLSVGNGGTVAPGTSNALGSINVTQGITLDEGSTTLIKMSAASGLADQLGGVTNVAFGGTLQLTNIFGLLGNGDAFKLFNADHFTGAFAALSPASPGPGLRWNTNQLSVDGTLRVFSVPTPAPAITSASCSAGSVQLSASGGIPYDPCYLLTSTNLAAPPEDWLPCATNRFDSAGQVSIVRTAAPDEPQRFYRLWVE